MRYMPVFYQLLENLRRHLPKVHVLFVKVHVFFLPTTCPLCQGTCLLPTYHMSSLSTCMSSSYLPHVLFVKVHVFFLPTTCPLCQGACLLPTYHMSSLSRYMSTSYLPHVP